MTQAIDKEWEDGDDFALVEAGYYQGIYDACEYFRDELGIEDAMDTSIAQEAIEYLDNKSKEE